ncbi:cadherin repeat domain-containing protein, partial [Microvirga flocculans]
MTLTIKLAAGNGGTPDSTDPGGSVRFNENSLTKDMLIGTIEGGQPGWTYKFNFADGFYGDGGGRFYIVGNKIYVKAVVDPATGESLFNFEVQGLHTMSVLAFATPDAVVDVDEGQFGVYVDDVNDAPVNLALNPPTGTVLQVAENLPANQLVGTLVEFDEDRDAGMGDGDGIFTYAITVNPGNKFALRDGANGLKEVVTTGPLDYEANDPLLKTDTVNGGKYYEITVRVTDNGGAKAGTPLSTEKTFRVYVTDVNDGNTSPTDISLSSTTVAEDQTAGAVIGTLSAT